MCKPKLYLYYNVNNGLWYWKYRCGKLIFSTLQRYKTKEKCRLYALLFAKKTISKLDDFEFFLAKEITVKLM